MVKHYKEAPWWWYIGILVLSFVLGLIVATTQNITLPPWAYIVSLLLGCLIAPFVSPESSRPIIPRCLHRWSRLLMYASVRS